MRLSIFVFLAAIVPHISVAQSISVAPISMVAWGVVPNVGSVSVEYKDIGIHYFHVYKPQQFARMKDGKEISSGYSQSTFAASYIPIELFDVFRIGLLGSINKFPTDKATRLNLWLEIGFKINRFKLSYVHISNGAYLFHDINPGLDRLRLTYKL